MVQPQRGDSTGQNCRPVGATTIQSGAFQGLTPLAIDYRPVGAANANWPMVVAAPPSIIVPDAAAHLLFVLAEELELRALTAEVMHSHAQQLAATSAAPLPAG